MIHIMCIAGSYTDKKPPDGGFVWMQLAAYVLV